MVTTSTDCSYSERGIQCSKLLLPLKKAEVPGVCCNPLLDCLLSH